MKRKGFTLIELLAVIVILAVIALIATPIVINIINSSKETSKERSAELYASAAEQAIMTYKMENMSVSVPSVFYVTSTADLCMIELDNQNNCVSDKIINVDIKGDKPKAGSKITYIDGVVDVVDAY